MRQTSKQRESAARAQAETLYALLRASRVRVELSYDDNRTVLAGPVRVQFTPYVVWVDFPNLYGDPDDDTPVRICVGGEINFGSIETLVHGLLLAVTP
jgi:hypothetical protein